MNAWPTGGFAGWQAFADALHARMALLQVHVQPDWLYALCTSCGWDIECTRPEISRFRFESASHVCPPAESSTDLVPAAVEEVLF